MKFFLNVEPCIIYITRYIQPVVTTEDDYFASHTAQGEVDLEVALGDDKIEDDFYGKYKEERLTEEAYTQAVQTPTKSNILSISTYVAQIICFKSSLTFANMHIWM